MPISLLALLSCEIYSDVRKHPLNSKPVPQIDPTNYLELFRRSCSLKIRCQTFSVVMGERNPFFPVSAPGLFAWTKNHKISYHIQNAKQSTDLRVNIHICSARTNKLEV